MAPWLRFFRLRLAATAVSNVLVGAVLSLPSWEHLPLLETALLVASTLLVYMFGMGLNDLRDRERDALNAPLRPLPSGAIPVHAARGALVVLLAGSLALAAPLGVCALAVWAALFVCILLYDLLLKDVRILGPVVMGGVRFCLVAFGATAMHPAASLDYFPIPGIEVMVAAVVVFAYVASLTQYSLFEEVATPHQLRRHGRELFWAVVLVLGLLAGLGNHGVRPFAAVAAMILWVGAYALRPLREADPPASRVTLRLLVGLLLLDTVILVSYHRFVPASIVGFLGVLTWWLAPVHRPGPGGEAS